MHRRAIFWEKQKNDENAAKKWLFLTSEFTGAYSTPANATASVFTGVEYAGRAIRCRATVPRELTLDGPSTTHLWHFQSNF